MSSDRHSKERDGKHPSFSYSYRNPQSLEDSWFPEPELEDDFDGDQLPKRNDNSSNLQASPFSYTGLQESLPAVGQHSIPAAVSRHPKQIDEEISSLSPLPPNLLLNRTNLSDAPTSIPYWSLGIRASPAVPPAPYARIQGPVGLVYDHLLPEAFSSPYRTSCISAHNSPSSFALSSSNASPPPEIETWTFPKYGGGNDRVTSPLELHAPRRIPHEDRHRPDRDFPPTFAEDSRTTDRDHTRRLPCEWEGCNATFSRKADVNRHRMSTHSINLIDCDVKNCGRTGQNGFARKDHLLEHMRGYHNMDLPKRRFQNGKGRHQV